MLVFLRRFCKYRGALNDTKIIFLDFDGVIRLSQNGFGSVGYQFDYSKIRMVRELAEEFGASVVVTSTWREMYDLPRIITEMRGGLETHHFHSSWMTPILSATSRCRERAVPRGVEVLTWLYSHPEVTQFVIFDDLPERGFQSILDHFINCDHVEGLTKGNIAQAREILARAHPAFCPIV